MTRDKAKHIISRLEGLMRARLKLAREKHNALEVPIASRAANWQQESPYNAPWPTDFGTVLLRKQRKLARRAIRRLAS